MKTKHVLKSPSNKKNENRGNNKKEIKREPNEKRTKIARLCNGDNIAHNIKCCDVAVESLELVSKHLAEAGAEPIHSYSKKQKTEATNEQKKNPNH